MKNFIIDMDGVLVQGNQIIPGADEFIKRLRKQKRKFLLLTNNPMYTLGTLPTACRRLAFKSKKTKSSPQPLPRRHSCISSALMAKPLSSEKAA